MSRNDAPNFGMGVGDITCWNCDYADCINRDCYKYDFAFEYCEKMSDFKCDSFAEI